MQPSLVEKRLRITSTSAAVSSNQNVATGVTPDLWLQSSSSFSEVTSSYLHSRTKRALDISAALVLLLIFVPLFFAVSLLVKISSPGPSLFRQSRYGNLRKPFFIFKFRSMYHENSLDKRVEQAKQNDSRVTPIGRIIRRTSIDELPQLINVVKGDMSLVGPRPHALAHDDHYASHVTNYENRFLAKPGITGLAQVSGSRGATPEISDMKRRVDFDIMYVRQATLMLDCKILLQTVHEVFASRTAY